jgi:hypothetical protein
MKGTKVAQELLFVSKELLSGSKEYYLMENVGRARYTVNFHDGASTHKDGSDFYDIRIFRNRKEVQDLVRKGYKERQFSIERALEERKKNKTGGSMNGRDRLTARDSRGIVAEIEDLERLIKADDGSDKPEEVVEDDVDVTEEVAEETADETEEVGQSEDLGGGQNARAMKNWPMTASEREVLARRLVAMARRLMA